MCGRLKHHESKHDQNAMHFTVRIDTLHFSAKPEKAKSVLPRLAKYNSRPSLPANSNPFLMRQHTAIADGPSLLGTPLTPTHIRAALPSMTHRLLQPAAPNAQPPPSYDVTQNVPKCPTFLRNPLSQAGCRPIRHSQPPKPPVLPATEYDKMRQFATHFSEKPPLRRPPAQPQPPWPHPHPCHSAQRHRPLGRLRLARVPRFANGPTLTLTLTLRYLRTHSGATRLRRRGRAMEATAWPTQLSCTPTPTVHSRTP